MLELRYILLSVVSVLIIIVSLILVKYRNLLRINEIQMSKQEVLGRMFLRKIKKLGEPKTEDDIKSTFKRLNDLMREFFRELYNISYEFAYIELNEELVKSGVDENTRNDIIDYTMHIAEYEYGKSKMSEQDFYFILGESIKIIDNVTGHSEAEIKKHVLEKTGPEQPKIPKKEEKEPEMMPPEKEPRLKKLKDRLEPPTKEEVELEKEILIPKKDEERLGKLRGLLIKAEMNMKDKKAREAMENYTHLRSIYDTLNPDVKMNMNEETKRIIALYNSLLKEYKNILRG